MFKSKFRISFPLLLFVFLLLCCLSLFLSDPALSVISTHVSGNSNDRPLIILDAGHGGRDPGKVSDAGTLEKDINLAITLKVRELLASHSIDIVLTRDSDSDLSTTDKGHKMSDLENRIALIEKHSPDLVVSIHQNSYPDPLVVGAQCFYHKESEEGQKLATLLQNQIVTNTTQTKIREIKNNESYYILKYSPATTAIIECGFLSSPEEEKLLLSEAYQDKMAWAIHLGILQYLKTAS